MPSLTVRLIGFPVLRCDFSARTEHKRKYSKMNIARAVCRRNVFLNVYATCFRRLNSHICYSPLLYSPLRLLSYFSFLLLLFCWCSQRHAHKARHRTGSNQMLRLTTRKRQEPAPFGINCTVCGVHLVFWYRFDFWLFISNHSYSWGE